MGFMIGEKELFGQGKWMKIYKCIVCDHEYNEHEEDVLFKDLPDDWECPDCSVGKDMFEVWQ